MCSPADAQLRAGPGHMATGPTSSVAGICGVKQEGPPLAGFPELPLMASKELWPLPLEHPVTVLLKGMPA